MGKGFDAADVRRLLMLAADVPHRDRAFHRQAVAALEEAGIRAGSRLVGSTLGACLGEALRGAWSRGWQPADVARFVERRLGAGCAGYLSDVIADDVRRFSPAAVHHRWFDQLRQLGGEVWWDAGEPHLGQWAARKGVTNSDALADGLALLALLIRLPRLPKLCPPPGEGAPGPAAPARQRRNQTEGDVRMLDRVRALLAKAESTTFAEEAEAFTAKAQELMARHAIDRAMVEARSGRGDAPNGVRLAVDDPYASGKALLLQQVADANGCQTVWCKDLGFASMFGFEADLESVELLYTSLLVQATTAMVAAGSQVDHRGRSRTRSFRQSFLVAYADRLGIRLRAAQAASQESAGADYGEALLPVLADRSAAVADAVDEVFPDMKRTLVSTSNWAGSAAGKAAADLAHLSASPEVPAEVA